MIIISLVILALIAVISAELRIILVAVIVALAVAFYLFNSLTIEVSESELQWYFGPGLLRKRVPLSDIAKVEPVELPRMSGSGIGYALGGWVYFIKRGDGVQIHRRNNSVVTFGTDDQAGLLAALSGKQTN
jgi:hypothetical protein